MQMFAFFMAVFSSASWLIYAFMFVRAKLEAVSLWEQSPEVMLLMLSVIFLPLLTIWMVFGYVNQFIGSRSMNRKQTELLTQLQKNQDYTDLVVRVMLDAEHEIKDGFVINKFDVLINDMNEALSEIIQRCNIASSAQLEVLWQRVGRGERWALGKAVVEAGKNQNTFEAWVREKVERDKVFRGSLLEFCSRYQNLLQLLEKHDRDRIFLSMIEKGVLGKVYSLIAPLSTGMQDIAAPSSERVAASSESSYEAPDRTAVLKLATMEEPAAQNTIMNVDKNDEDEDEDDYDEAYEPKPSIFSRFKFFGRKQEPQMPTSSIADRDPFFKALHNSFQDSADSSEVSFGRFGLSSGDNEPRLSSAPMFNSALNETAPTDENVGVSAAIKKDWGASSSAFEQTQPSLSATVSQTAMPTAHEADNVTNWSAFRQSVQQPMQQPIQQSIQQSVQQSVQQPMQTAVGSSYTMSAASEVPAAPEKDEDLVYPFGGWTDENNYRK